MRYKQGDHVVLEDKRTGIVKFIGHVKFAKGEWYGLMLDDPLRGENDGQVKGKRYFKCSKNKGTFVQKDEISELLPQRKEISSRELKKTISKFKMGSRVKYNNRLGTVKWIGILTKADGVRLGVELDDEFEGKNNGSAKGKQWFKCRAGQGVFWKPERVQLCMGSNSSLPKTKSVSSLKIKHKITPSTVLLSNDDLPRSLELSPEEKKTGPTRVPKPLDKLQSTVMKFPVKGNASSHLARPEWKQDELELVRKSDPSTPRMEVKSEESRGLQKSLSPGFRKKSFADFKRRGRKLSPAPSFTHSKFPKMPYHCRKATEPLLTQFAQLFVDRNSGPESCSWFDIIPQRSYSLSALDEKVDSVPRISETRKLGEKRKVRNLDVKGTEETNAKMLEENRQLKETLERVKQEKFIMEKAKTAVENEKIKIVNHYKELKLKLEESIEQFRKDRLIFNSDREKIMKEMTQYEDCQSNFCKKMAEFESGQKSMKKELRAKNDELERVKKDLAWVRKELHCTMEQNKKLQSKLEYHRESNVTNTKQGTGYRESIEISSPSGSPPKIKICGSPFLQDRLSVRRENIDEDWDRWSETPSPEATRDSADEDRKKKEHNYQWKHSMSASDSESRSSNLEKNATKAGEPFSSSDFFDDVQINSEIELSPLISPFRKVKSTYSKDDNQMHLGSWSPVITFSHPSPSLTPASTQGSLIDDLNVVFCRFKEKVRYVRDYINKTKEELSTLKTNPTTLDETKRIIGVSRMKQIEEKLTEVKNLIRYWEAAEITNGLDFNVDRARDLITIAKKCVVELKELEKVSLKKIDMFVTQVYTTFPKLQNDYWQKAKQLRRELWQIQLKWSSKNNTPNKKIEKLENEYEEITRDNAILKMMGLYVQDLRWFGDFLGKLKRPETVDCPDDSLELVKLHRAIFKKNQEMIDALPNGYLVLVDGSYI